MAFLVMGRVVVEYLKKEGAPYSLGIPGHGCLPPVGAQAYFPRSAARRHGNWDPTAVPAYLRK